MPTINHQQAQADAGVGGGTYEETNEQRQGWKNLVLNYMANLSPRPLPDTTFLIKGCIYQFQFDNGGYFTEEVTNDKGEKRKRAYTKAICCITDPSIITGPIEDDKYRLEFPPKKITASFFDGWTKKGRSDIRGGMYTVHFAVTHEEPPEALVKGTGSWDTETYERMPVLLRIRYKGKTDEQSPYASRRARRTFFVDGFERDPDHIPAHLAEDTSDLDDEPTAVADEPTPVPTGAAPSASTPAAETPAASASSGKGTHKKKAEAAKPVVTAEDLTAEWDDPE